MVVLSGIYLIRLLSCGICNGDFILNVIFLEFSSNNNIPRGTMSRSQYIEIYFYWHCNMANRNPPARLSAQHFKAEAIRIL